MKILKGGKTKETLKGKCKDCKCRVTVTKTETKEFIDRDTQSGMATRYVHCPECENEYLWVNDMKTTKSVLQTVCSICGTKRPTKQPKKGK